MRRLETVLLLLSLLLPAGCLSVSQDPCEALTAMCIDGDVWVCRADGSGWDPEMACPDGRCSDGRCELDPLPPVDVSLHGADTSQD